MSECAEEKVCLDEAARRLLAVLVLAALASRYTSKYSPISENETAERGEE